MEAKGVAIFAHMIAYDPRNWLKPVLQFHRADTFRKLLPLLVLMAAYTAGVKWVEMNHLHLREDHPLRNITVMHGLLGIAISMLLVFRTNTAYDRWWEGRKLWGSLVNCSRNLAMKLDALLPPDAATERAWFASAMGLYARELRNHLLREQTRLELDALPHPELRTLDRSRHVPSQIVALIQTRLVRLRREGRIDGDHLLLLNNDMTALLDICGACERIKNTPIPYSYTTFIKKFIVIYTLTLPLGHVFALGWIAVPVVTFIFYVLASLELIAEEIEDPFGGDSNDLPMDRLSAMIDRNAREILE